MSDDDEFARAQPSGFRSLDEQLGLNRGFLHLVRKVDYGEHADWALIVELVDSSGSGYRLTFADTLSFRVHHEGEIMHYWAARDAERAPVANFYEIGSSRYLEELRLGITTVAHHGAARNFLVASESDCVEVLSNDLPSVELISP